MIYKLRFHPLALKEWKKLDKSIQNQFKKILERRLEDPHVSMARLTGPLKSCYKIKLRQLGYRLVYQVDNDILYLLVLKIGKRNKSEAYQEAIKRVC